MFVNRHRVVTFEVACSAQCCVLLAIMGVNLMPVPQNRAPINNRVIKYS